MQWLTDALTNGWGQLKFLAIVLGVGLLLEQLRPAQRGQPWTHIAFNLGYVVFIVFINTLLIPPLMALMRPLAHTYGMHFPVAFADDIGGQLLQALAFFAIFDFFYYWFHRAQHTLPGAWPLHKLHHSEESLNVTTTLRHHWLEDPIRTWLILLPIGLLFDQKAVTVVWLATVMMLWGYFVHANVRLPLGPLTPLFAGPQWHRLHHSIEEQHRDRNFAAFFPIYDIIFGTYSRPGFSEYPATGLHSRENLNGPLRATLSPFRDWWQAMRGARQQTIAPAEQHSIESVAHEQGDQGRQRDV